MESGKTFNRWLIVVGALLIQVSLGAIYIYSVFKPGLKARFPDWSNTDLALPSMLVLLFFGLATIFAGRVQDKIGPRYVAMTGAVLLGLGLAAGLLLDQPVHVHPGLRRHRRHRHRRGVCLPDRHLREVVPRQAGPHLGSGGRRVRRAAALSSPPWPRP